MCVRVCVRVCVCVCVCAYVCAGVYTCVPPQISTHRPGDYKRIYCWICYSLKHHKVALHTDRVPEKPHTAPTQQWLMLQQQCHRNEVEVSVKTIPLDISVRRYDKGFENMM